MYDLKLQRTCDHAIFDEQVSLTGTSPSYFSYLQFQSDGATNFMTVRRLETTEGLSNFNYRRDGFTNWNLSSDGRQVNWNTLGLGAGIAGFIDASSHISPAATMMVSYRAHKDSCPLCDHALRLTRDVDFDVRGRFTTVSGRNKVKQMIFKALLTELGANEILPGYGSSLGTIIGQKFDAFTEFKLHNSIETAVRFLVDEQQTQPGLPLDEVILNVSRIGIIQDSTDPRIIKVEIEVQTGDFQRENVSFNIVNY